MKKLIDPYKMFGLIIAFICAILVLYKLFSLIGYHDENGLQKEIKDVNVIKSETQEIENKITQDYQITKNSEVDDKIFRSLNQELQVNISKIFEIDQNFNLSSFIEHCDFLFTKIFEILKSENFITLQELCNEQSLEKLKSIVKTRKFTKTLIKIDTLKIEKINFSENKEILISISIYSEQMIPNEKNEFAYKKCISNLTMGKSLKEENESKWLLVNFDII